MESDQELYQTSLNQQAALMWYIEELARSYSGDAVGRGPFVAQKVSEKIYGNIATIRSKSQTNLNTGHIDLTKFLLKSPSLLELLKKCDGLSGEDKIIQLLSIININFWILKTFDDGKTINVPIGAMMSETAEKQLLEKNPNLLLSVGGVSLTEMNCSFKGATPGEINSNIEAKMVFSFPHFAQFTTQFEVDGKFFHWADILAPGGNPNDSVSNYKIKLVIEYKVNKSTIKTVNPNLTDKEIEDIKLAVESFNTYIYLIPISHDVEFNEDGIGLKFTVNYQGAINYDMSKLDIFIGSPIKQNLIDALEKYNKINKCQDKKIKAIDENNNTEKGKEEEKKKLTEQNKESSEKAERELEARKNELYSSILRKIIGLEPKTSSYTYSGVYYAVIDPASLGIKVSDQEVDKEWWKKPKQVKAWWKVQNLLTRTRDGLDENGLANQYNYLDTSLGLSLGERSAKTAKEIAARVNYNNPSDQDKKIYEQSGEAGKKYLLQYMYLGDIIDAAASCLEVLRTAPPNIKKLYGINEVPRIILGNVKINYPNGDPSAPDTEVREMYVNLADIPISFDLFQSFYTNNILKDRPEKVSLEYFINEIITELVVPALGPTYFGNKAGFSNNQIKISSVTFSLPFQNGNDAITGKPANQSFSGNIYVEDVQQKIIDKSRKPNQQVGNYIVFYDSAAPNKILDLKDNITDLERIKRNYDNGIISLQIPYNRNTGLNKITFSKVDMEGAREALVLNEKDGGTINSLKMKQLYEITAEHEPGMIFLRPGDLVYVRPTAWADLGPVSKNFAIDMGFNSYFLLTSVDIKYIGGGGYRIASSIKGTATSSTNGGRLQANRKALESTDDKQGC